MNTFKNSAWLVLGAQLVLACGGNPATTDPDSDAGSCTFPANGMPNPASDYCERSGYTLSGSMCVFPDGSQCDEWAFFSGECQLTRTFCAAQGNTPKVENNAVTCIFSDGSTCEDWDYSRGCCGPKS